MIWFQRRVHLEFACLLISQYLSGAAIWWVPPGEIYVYSVYIVSLLYSTRVSDKLSVTGN